VVRGRQELAAVTMIGKSTVKERNPTMALEHKVFIFEEIIDREVYPLERTSERGR
jgi:hypothetical protein